MRLQTRHPALVRFVIAAILFAVPLSEKIGPRDVAPVTAATTRVAIANNESAAKRQLRSIPRFQIGSIFGPARCCDRLTESGACNHCSWLSGTHCDYKSFQPQFRQRNAFGRRSDVPHAKPNMRRIEIDAPTSNPESRSVFACF